MIRYTEKAREKAKHFIESSNDNGAGIRIAITERNEKGFTYHFGLDPYSNEQDDDVIVRDGGFATRIDPESAKWLRGATVDWIAKDGKEGFSVLNPNSPIPDNTPEGLKKEIIDMLKTIYDPEIPVNIYDLGLIYDIKINEDSNVVDVVMTLTAPNCPAAEQLPHDVKVKTESVPGVKKAKVEITWEPAWTPDQMSDEAKLELGI
ncbi:MAG: iron-sulfur cluster assembly protein [Bdellovibrionota bacterium]